MVRASLEIGNSNQNIIQELMEKHGRRKWKIWISVIGIFVIVLVLIVVAILLLTNGKTDGGDGLPQRLPVSFDDVMQGKLATNRFNATWISDNELLFTDAEGNLMMYNMQANENSMILPKDNQILAVSFDQQLSADKKYLLLAYSYRKLYRHSYLAQYIALGLESKEQIQIILNNNESFVELAVWGPVGNSIVFVQNNNIFYRSSILAPTVRITENGTPGGIYNGVPDWVYEEEVLGSNKAIWFSEDGIHLAYGTYNDTSTPIMTIPIYGQPGEPKSQYPGGVFIRYPKVGTRNPTAGLTLVNLLEPEKQASLPVPESLSEPILASVSFATNTSVAVVWTNRVQNESVTMLCSSFHCKEIFRYDESNGWVDMLRPLIFMADGLSFFTILPKEIGSDSWRQLAQIKRGSVDGAELWTPTFLTSVRNTVMEIVHWDENSKTLWYIATSEDDSAVQHLYTISLDGKHDCFTCNITHSSGSQCLYNEAQMSKSGSFVAISCLGPQVPEVYLHSKAGTKVKVWENNAKIAELLEMMNVPVVRRLSVQVADPSLPPAQVILLTPPNADLSGAVKYPLLVNVYGGPDTSQVLEKWNVDWSTSLVARWNITVALIDGRGSGLKGNNNLFAGYRNLGTVEINDQINVTRHLHKSLGYIDPERTCIWGWSYGGYASALALSRGGSTFRCAVSVAPVTDWLYYDSIYTERYMGLPNNLDNKKGYVASQLNTRETAMALNKKKFMLIHGTLDDNVHFQQSMMLSRVLQLNDVLFTQLSYPDEDHGLAGVKHHLYHSIEQFLQRNMMSKT